MSLLLRLADALNRDDRQALGLNLGLSMGLGLLANGMTLWLGRDTPADAVPWFAPPGWVAALVWIALFALLGAARWQLNSYTIIGVTLARTMVTLLIVVCLFWPIYSLSAVDLTIRLVGNVGTVLIAIASIVIVRQRSIEAASLITPLVVWLAFTTLVVIATMMQL